MISTMHGAPGHGIRTYRGNGSVGPGAFTRGNRAYHGERDTRYMINCEDEATRPARRPWRELPDAKVKIVRAARIACPGCGIVPPRSRACDTCARS
jgi:hypothetical protein